MRPTQTEVWPAPVRGWVASGTVVGADKSAAEVLDNFFPTAQGARLRAGYALHASAGATVKRMMSYDVALGAALFAATASDIYEISSPADAEVTPTATLTGLSSGDWSATNFRTSGGSFLIAVNGTDHAWYWDGTSANPIVGGAVNEVAYDALTAAFTVGETVTGGTSSASAEILAISPTSATAGVLKLGAITGGPFQDNETLTDGATGSATANGASGSASSVTITGVETNALSQVWQFKERLFFIEKDTLIARYLPVDSIGGALGELNLGSVFRLGGSLLFGATWSIDSGSGLDDVCVFVTNAGEVAVYEGTDPSSASTWSLVGVYRTGKPVDKHASLKVGGDLLVATTDGIVSVAQLINEDRSSILESSLTAAIRDEWERAILNASDDQPINMTLWPDDGLLLIGTALKADGLSVAFVANAITGAWARWTNYDVRCAETFGGKLYFASSGGEVYEAEVGGNDNGTAYKAVYIPKFSEMQSPAIKVGNHVGLVARCEGPFDFGAKLYRDYNVTTLPAAPVLAEGASGAVWGTGVWGTSVWGDGGERTSQQKWKSAGNSGVSLSPGYAMVVNQTSAPAVEILMALVRYEVGNVL